MVRFVAGLLVFFGMHLITVTPALRRAVFRNLPDQPRRGIVALISLLGVALICLGWPSAPATRLFMPAPAAVAVAPILVPCALVLFLIGGLGFRGYIRRYLHHPMLMGAALWSGVHLAANGGLRETLLFGSFLAFSLYALGVVFGCGKRATFIPALKWDLVGIVVGLVVAIGILHSHRILFGVPVP